MAVTRKVSRAYISGIYYEDVYEESIKNPEKFWGKIAKMLSWSKPALMLNIFSGVEVCWSSSKSRCNQRRSSTNLHAHYSRNCYRHVGSCSFGSSFSCIWIWCR